jgi:hypothetical protein
MSKYLFLSTPIYNFDYGVWEGFKFLIGFVEPRDQHISEAMDCNVGQELACVKLLSTFPPNSYH